MTDYTELARQFVYDEVAVADKSERIPWVGLMNCFEAWLGYHGVDLDENRSVRSHYLVAAMADAGLPRTGGKSRFRVLGARLYIGTPDEFIADIAEWQRRDNATAKV